MHVEFLPTSIVTQIFRKDITAAGKLRCVYLRNAQPFYFGEEDYSISVKAGMCAIYFAGIPPNSLKDTFQK